MTFSFFVFASLDFCAAYSNVSCFNLTSVYSSLIFTSEGRFLWATDIHLNALFTSLSLCPIYQIAWAILKAHLALVGSDSSTFSHCSITWSYSLRFSLQRARFDRQAISISLASGSCFSFSFNLIALIEAKYFKQASSSLFYLKKLLASALRASARSSSL